MTRSELIAKITSRFPQLTFADTEVAVKAILDSMVAHLAKHGRIEIRGFGSFSVHIRPPRIGRNPKTGERVPVPANHTPHFKPGVELRERVNKSAAAVQRAAVDNPELPIGFIVDVLESMAERREQTTAFIQCTK